MGEQTEQNGVRRPSPRLTFEDAVEIHRLLRQGEFQHRIAARFGVNAGRIAEVKKGEKFPESLDVALGKIKQPSLFQ